MMEIKDVYVKTRAEFGKQCMFDLYGPHLDERVKPNPDEMNDYIVRSHCHSGVQHSRQLALHEVQTDGTTFKNSGMYHFEGGWPKEINPRDEEVTARFRRRVEKDSDWAPKLRNLFEMTEQSILQNSAVNIYQHYFDDMIPTELVLPLGLRTVNVYADPETPTRPVNDISWSSDSGSRIVVSYCFLEFGRLPDYSNTVYIWQVANPNKPYMALETFCPSVVSEFNPRDPSVLASGLMSGQVCNWDIRTGTSPVQVSHRQFSHRDTANAVMWQPSKSNSEFFSTSTDGYAMWWDTRNLREPTEVLMFDFENPNEPNIDRAIGISCLNFGPVVGTKFMFGMENGIIVSGSRKAKSNAEKLAARFEAHHGPVLSVDRNVFNPSIFLSVGDWTARVWMEDTKEDNLISTYYLPENPISGCWNKCRFSVFYVITGCGLLMAWDLLQGFDQPILTIQLCKERLTAIAPHEEGTLLAIGNSVGQVYLVESMESLQTFEKKDRAILSEYLERSSRFVKAVDTRLREIRLTLASAKQPEEVGSLPKATRKPRKSTGENGKQPRSSKQSKERERKSMPKEKKKVKEELSDIAEAEAKYFEIVEKEKENFGVQVVPSRDMSSYWSASSKSKMSVRKSKRKLQSSSQAIQVTEPASKEQKRPREKKAKVPKPAAKVSSLHLREESVAIVEPKGAPSQPISTKESARWYPPRGSKRSSAKKPEMKKPKQRVLVKQPRPCKGDVCKPKVCCWRTVPKPKLQKEGAKSSFRVEEGKTRSTEASRGLAKVERQLDAGTRRERSTGTLGKQSSVSLAMLMDSSGSLGQRTKYSNIRISRILREMREPPTELTEEVERAKSEIREAGRLTGMAKRRYIVRRILESREKQKSKTRVGQKSKEDRVDTETEDESSRTDRKGEVARTRRRRAHPLDPCTPQEDRTVMKEFSAVLGDPKLESIIDKPERGKAYLEELETARSRVYPRISEFHSIE